LKKKKKKEKKCAPQEKKVVEGGLYSLAVMVWRRAVGGLKTGQIFTGTLPRPRPP